MTAAVSLFLGVFVYFNGEKTRLNFSWLLNSIAISLWSVGLFGVVSSNTKPAAWFWQHILDIGGICVPILFFNFVLYLVKKEKKIMFLQIFSFVTGTVLITLSFTDFFKTGVSPKFGINHWIDPGKLYFIFPLFFIFFVLASAFILIKEYRGTDDRNFKRQLLYMLIAQLFGFGGGLTDFFPQLFNVYPFGNYFIILYVIFISYAALKHHLFDIKVIATELLTFSIWVFLAVKVLLSRDLSDFLLNGVVLLAIIGAGTLLIRSVLREVEQRERMEKLSKDLEQAYGAEKSARQRVERAKVEDEALLGSIGDGVIAIDKNGEVMFVNRAAEQMLGFKSDQAIDKPYEDILEIQNEKGDVLAGEENPLEAVLNSGKKIITDATSKPEKTIYFVRSDKSKFPAAVTVAPVILQGETIGAINVFRDITVERQIDKSKSEFVSLASHQLRTPLTTIKWYAEMLQDNKKAGKLTAKQKKYLDVLYKGNLRMIKLVDVMLDVSRLDAGKVKIRKEMVDISEIAKVVIEEEKFNIKNNKQKFIFDSEEKNSKTFTDPNQLRIVFQNLISNAVKYTPKGGKVECSIKKQDDYFLFSVQDNGIGIPRDQQKRIFEKLFRAENAFSHQPDGNGLGLYAAKATIENLGGKIWFESKEGQGTTFFVTIPIKGEETA